VSQIFSSKDMLENSGEFDLPHDFFGLIDPDGANVIEDGSLIKNPSGRCYCTCLFKFKGYTSPFRVFVNFSEDFYSKFVQEIDINSLTTLSMRM
jgi:hypothetical protein